MSLHTHGPAHRARRRLVRQQVGRSRSPWEVLTAAPRIVHPLVVIADDARSFNEHAGAFRVLTKARHAVRVLHLRGRPHRAAACESDDPSAHEPAHRPSCRPSCRRDSRLSNGPTPAAGRPPARLARAGRMARRLTRQGLRVARPGGPGPARGRLRAVGPGSGGGGEPHPASAEPKHWVCAWPRLSCADGRPLRPRGHGRRCGQGRHTAWCERDAEQQRLSCSRTVSRPPGRRGRSEAAGHRALVVLIRVDEESGRGAAGRAPVDVPEAVGSCLRHADAALAAGDLVDDAIFPSEHLRLATECVLGGRLAGVRPYCAKMVR